MKPTPYRKEFPASPELRPAWWRCTLLLWLGLAGVMFAIDPPHDSDTPFCGDCHAVHHASGVTLTSVAGNANLCLSCHVAGGKASRQAFLNSDQAQPAPGLPASLPAGGTSHRWDSSAAGRVVFLGGNSTGTIQPSGTYTGAYAKTFTLTIAASGDVGTATFNWTATVPGGGTGSNLLTGTNVLLDQGVFLAFADGTNTSFVAGDQWRLLVRPNLRSPTNSSLVSRLMNGTIMCSTCHNEHSEAREPFDSRAFPYTTNLAGVFIGTNRHFLRIDSQTDQLCAECHFAYFRTNASSGSHPVDVYIPTNSLYSQPVQLPLDKIQGQMRCSSCHDMHYAAATDGSLLRMVLTNQVKLCVDCHLLAGTNTPAAHFNRTNGALWPGGQYGSLFPQITNSAMRGACDNCHQVHGWPNATNNTIRYEKLLVDREENLCFTCHDANGPATKNVRTDFTKAFRHPIGDADALRRPGRSVECQDCHNPHQALAGAHSYATTATLTRNRISNPLRGVEGVAVNLSSLTNFQTIPTNRYTLIPKTTGATYEYQICFKCHSGYSFGALPPVGLTPVYSTGTATFTSGSATVTGSGTAWNSGMVGLWIYRTNNPGTVHRITAVASATSLTITPPYTNATAATQFYAMSGETDVAQEFSSMNKSGHPIMTGLDNYPNSVVVSGKRGLLAAALKAPWNVNVGQQTMMCSDCHNTDAALPAAQGPHGSAVRFQLRGTNPNNWPDVANTSAGFTSSWCANCHNNSSSVYHGGEHTGYRCYVCHIVIPHGGKMSRLIGDRDRMPARYAFNNTLTTMQMRTFTKTTATGYGTGNCGAACHHSSGTEHW